MKRLLAIIISMCFLAAMFAGCGTGGTATGDQANTGAPAKTAEAAADNTAKAPAGLSGEITFAMQEDQTNKNAWQKQVIDDFVKANPGVKINATTYTGNYAEGLQNAFTAGQGPDVFFIGTMEAPTFIDAGKFEDLSSWVGSKAYDISDFDKGCLNAYSMNGKLYALPKDQNKLGLFYNKKLFKDAGLEGKIPATWDELLATCKILKDKLPKGTYPIVFENSCNRSGAFMTTNGTWPLAADGKAPALNDPKVAESIQFMMDLYKQGYAVAPKDIGHGWAGDTFGKGMAAMAIEGGWMIGALKNNKDVVQNMEQYGIAELPYKTAKNTVVLGGAWAMSSESKNKEVAWAFLTYLASVDVQKKATEGLPVRKSLQDAFVKDNPEFGDFAKFGAYGTGWSFGILGAALETEFNTALDDAKQGAKDVKTAFDDAQKNADQTYKDKLAATKQ